MCQIVQTTEDALSTRVLHATIHTLELYGIYLSREGTRPVRGAEVRTTDDAA